MYEDENGLQRFIRRHTGDPDPLRRIARAHIAKEASEREPRAELERESVISLLIFFRPLSLRDP